jgi:hypothetical protein
MGQARCQPHEYERTGTAKLLTLFHPASGLVRAHGVTSACNAVWHPWLQTELEQGLAELPAVTMPQDARPPLAQWAAWLGRPAHASVPPLRLIVVWDNLSGHLNPACVIWRYAHGVLPL